jgi:hypothetical protein
MEQIGEFSESFDTTVHGAAFESPAGASIFKRLSDATIPQLKYLCGVYGVATSAGMTKPQLRMSIEAILQSRGIPDPGSFMVEVPRQPIDGGVPVTSEDTILTPAASSYAAPPSQMITSASQFGPIMSAPMHTIGDSGTAGSSISAADSRQDSEPHCGRGRCFNRC